MKSVYVPQVFRVDHFLTFSQFCTASWNTVSYFYKLGIQLLSRPVPNFISNQKYLCNWAVLCISFSILILSFFFRHGQKVAQKPHLYIGLCFIVSGLFSIGLLNYQPEANPYKLWIPKNSDYVLNTDWLWKNYPPNSRYNEHQLLITGNKLLKWDAFVEWTSSVFVHPVTKIS